MKTYNQIKDSLSGLSRKDQYAQLLDTKEWFEFRSKIISLGGNKCVICGSIEGYIEIPIPIDEIKQKRKEVDRHNAELKTKYKDPAFRDRQTQRLTGEIDEPYEVKQFYPSTTRIIGKVILQVHHTLYIFNKLPWEYKRKYVQTLCSTCHQDIHANMDIYTYKDDSLSFRKKFPKCIKCNGIGVIEEYRHVCDGICFECGGQGIIFNDVVWEPFDFSKHVE